MRFVLPVACFPATWWRGMVIGFSKRSFSRNWMGRRDSAHFACQPQVGKSSVTQAISPGWRPRLWAIGTGNPADIRWDWALGAATFAPTPHRLAWHRDRSPKGENPHIHDGSRVGRAGQAAEMPVTFRVGGKPRQRHAGLRSVSGAGLSVQRDRVHTSL